MIAKFDPAMANVLKRINTIENHDHYFGPDLICKIN